MNFRKPCFVIALCVAAGCGGVNGGALDAGGAGGTGGAGGAGGTEVPGPVGQGSFRLSCDYDPLALDMMIELVVELSEPYSRSDATEATFSASVTLDEASVASFLDAGVTSIDIVSASVRTSVTGATPAALTSTFGAAPINDLDLQADPDDNGMPGPHRLEFDPATTTSNATAGASEVTFDLGFDGVSFALGDFNVPGDCRGLSLVGVAVQFPVDP